MSRISRSAVLLTGALLAIGGTNATRCDAQSGRADSSAAAESDTVELIFLGGERPLRLRLCATIDGNSVGRLRRKFFRQLFRFFDRDGDGELNADEAERAPSATTIRQWSWGYFQMTGAPPSSSSASGASASSRCSGRPLSCKAFLAQYIETGIGGVTVAGARCRASEALTEQLVTQLDQNHNGKLSLEELSAAERALRPLDVNGDELIASGELVFQIDSPYPLATTLLTPLSSESPTAPPTLTLWAVKPVGAEVSAGALLEQSDRDGNARLSPSEVCWSGSFFAERDANQDGRIDASELAEWLGTPPDAPIAVRFDHAAASTVRVRGGQVDVPSGSGAVAPDSADSRIAVEVRQSHLHQQFVHHRQEMTHRFAALDADGNRNLEAKEITGQDAPTFASLLALADRDDHGDLSHGELEAFLDLQQQAVASHVRLSILDHRRGLFTALDTDRDGQLSIPELRSASGLLGSKNVGPHRQLDPATLPRQYSLVFSRGRPVMHHPKALPEKTPPASAWFVAMDANSDGVVSANEFLGSREVFKNLDQNDDRLLKLEETDSGS